MSYSNKPLFLPYFQLGFADFLLQPRDSPSVYYKPLLHWCVEEGEEGFVRLLLRHPLIDVNKRNEEGQTALHISAQKGHEIITACLLGRGADPNLRDHFGTTPVFCAISGPCLSVLENLLSVSDLQVRGPHGESLLHWVVYNLCDPNDDHPLLAHMHCTKSHDMGNTNWCRVFTALWVTNIILLYFLSCVVSCHK